MCRIGDIYEAVLEDSFDGCVQTGNRPVLIVSNDKANEHSPVVTVIPFTGRLNKKRLPTHVYMKECGLPRPSVALVEQITAINKSQLLMKIGSISKTVYEERIKNAISIQLSL